MQKLYRIEDKLGSDGEHKEDGGWSMSCGALLEGDTVWDTQ